MHWLSVHCCALAQVQVGESRHTSTQDGSGAMATASRVLPEVFDSAPESWPWPPGAWRPSCFQFIPFVPFRGLVHEPEIEDLHFGHGQRSAPKSSFENGNEVIVFPHDALLGTTRSVSLRPWPMSSAARRYAELMFGRLCGLRVFLCVGVFARLCVGVLVFWCVVV